MTLTRGITILAISIAVLLGINHVLRVAGPGDERSEGYIHYFLVGRAEHPPLAVYAIYAVFSVFLFCQTAHAKHYEGTSKTFDAILTIFGFTCFIVGIGYAVAVAFRYTWLDLIPFFLLHNAVRLILTPIDQKKSGPLDVPRVWDWIIFGGSMAGFVVVPASLVALFVIRHFSACLGCTTHFRTTRLRGLARNLRPSTHRHTAQTMAFTKPPVLSSNA